MLLQKHKPHTKDQDKQDAEQKQRDAHRKIVNDSVSEIEHNEWKHHSGAG